MCNQNTLKIILDKVCRYSRDAFGDKLCAVKLYGSYARGDFDDESDIDVMVVVDLEASELSQYEEQFSNYSFDLALEYRTLPSVFLQDKATYEKYKNSYPFFKNIEKEGVDLVA